MDQQTIISVRDHLLDEVDRLNRFHDRRFIDGLNLAARELGRLADSAAPTFPATEETVGPLFSVLLRSDPDRRDLNALLDCLNDETGTLRVTVERLP